MGLNAGHARVKEQMFKGNIDQLNIIYSHGNSIVKMAGQTICQ